MARPQRLEAPRVEPLALPPARPRSELDEALAQVAPARRPVRSRRVEPAMELKLQ